MRETKSSWHTTYSRVGSAVLGSRPAHKSPAGARTSSRHDQTTAPAYSAIGPFSTGQPRISPWHPGCAFVPRERRRVHTARGPLVDADARLGPPVRHGGGRPD